MKKIFIVILFFMASFMYAESYQFSGDIWTHMSKQTDGQFTGLFWRHDLKHSNWNGLDPKKWGLISTTIGIGTEKSTGYHVLFFKYETSVRYSLPHYIISEDKNRDSYLLGGQRSNGDYSITKEKDGKYISIIVINLTPKDIKYLVDNKYFVITDSANGYDMFFGIPKEIFDESFNFLGLRY